MATSAREEFFVTCAPGIEPLLHEEIKALRLARVERQVGGVRFEGTLQDAWRANAELRTAVRVLMKVVRFQATNADALYQGAREVDWTRFLRPEGTLRVDAHVNESTLDHSLFVEQRTKDAIVDAFRESSGARPSVNLEDADLGIHVHVFRDRCTILVDSSGDSLHKRGWRKFQGRAPLAETLAAAVVLASGWDRKSPLVDPFCGSGTLLVEAALIALDVAPGSLGRTFGFERWPGHDEKMFAQFLDKVRARAAKTKKLVIRGSDVNPAAIGGAWENLTSAGVESHVTVEVARAEDLAWKRGWNAWITANLPYGERVGDERDLAPMFERFGRSVREKCAGYRFALLTGNEKLTRSLALTTERRIALKNGAIDCELLVGAL